MTDWKRQGEPVLLVPITREVVVALFALTVTAYGVRAGTMEIEDCPEEFLKLLEAWQKDIPLPPAKVDA